MALTLRLQSVSIFFFFNDTATTEIYTLSLHDALPISGTSGTATAWTCVTVPMKMMSDCFTRDRKSTRLNSSHDQISYAVFCLKKKKIPAHTDSPEPRPSVPLVAGGRGYARVRRMGAPA